MLASALVVTGCMLPVVGFVALLYYDRTPYLLRRRGLKRGSYVRCPRCDALIAGESVRCAHCEASLDELVAPIRAFRPGYEGHPQVAVCIRCGRLNGPAWSQCKSCGTALERPAFTERERPSRRSRLK